MKKKEQKVVVKLGVWEWEWERIVELPVCWSRVGRTWRGCRFRHDDLELSVGHPEGLQAREAGWRRPANPQRMRSPGIGCQGGQWQGLSTRPVGLG